MKTRTTTTTMMMMGLLVSAAACTASNEDSDAQGDAVTEECPSATTTPTPARFDAELGAWLRTSATDLGDLSAALPRIADIVGDAKVIGFGEPEHGLHEFPELRNAVFQMLVEKKDVRAITLETGLMEARIVDQYVTDTAGTRGITLDEVLAKGFTHNMGEWEETAALVEWVRAHNVKAASQGKPLVRWGGKDLTLHGDTLTVPLADVAKYFDSLGEASKVAPLVALATKASEVTTFIERALKERVNVDHIDPDHLDAVCSLSYDQLSDAERVSIGQEIDRVLGDLDANHAAYAGKTGKKGEEEFQWARQLVVVAQQIWEDLEHRLKIGVVHGPTNSAGYSLTFIKKVYTAMELPLPPMPRVKFIERDYTPEELTIYQEGRKVREQHLADNVKALVKQHGKTFNFAATGHVQRARGLEDSGNGYAEGQFLAETYGKDYVVIGGTASEFESPPETGDERRDASIRAIRDARAAQAARPGSLEGRLESIGSTTSRFIFDLRKDPSPAGGAAACTRPRWVSEWLESPQLTWTGSAKFNVIPSQNYDAVYWIKKATLGHPRRPTNTGGGQH